MGSEMCIRDRGFPLCEGTAGIHYVTRRVFRSSMLQYFQVQYSGYTLSPRHNWPSVVLLIYSQYSLYYGLQYYSNTLSTRKHEINVLDTPSILGTFVATPAAALAAVAAAARLASLLLMCHPP